MREARPLLLCLEQSSMLRSLGVRGYEGAKGGRLGRGSTAADLSDGVVVMASA